MSFYTHMDSPVGRLLLAGTGDALMRIEFPSSRKARDAEAGWEARREPLEEAVRQLEAYFAGRLTVFDLPLAPEGTPFQKTIWDALQEIPFGETRTYAEIAHRIGRPRAIRAVGAANGSNPIPIVIPCHRVVGSDGDLTGFGGGLETKRKLLRLERALPAETGRLF